MKRVRGNKLVLSIALQKVQLVSGTKSTTDFVLTDGDIVQVRFIGNTTKAVTPEVSVNKLTIIDNGTLPCGSYGIEVLITTSGGDNLRYYDSDLFTIVERTSDADIVGNAEFDDDSSVSINASVYEASSGSTSSGLTTSQVQALLTPYAKDADLANVAKSGSYTDLKDKPTIPSAYDDTEIKAQIAAKQDASSAFDGDYNNLTNKPTIPTMPSDYLTSDDLQGYATTDELSGKVDKVSGKGLSSNDYTNEDKTKLAELQNYNDTALVGRVLALEAIDHSKYLTEHQSLVEYSKTANLNVDDWNDAASKAHEHTNKSVLDGITSTKVENWNKALPFENSYVGNANSWLTNGYTKTSTSTSNLPSGKNWGVLFFIAENATDGTGVQMWFGLLGEVYVRAITKKSPSSSWSQLSTLADLSSYLTTDSASQTYQVKGNYLTEHQKIKTINGQSIVGEGNISITSNSTESYDDTEVRTLISGKADKEVIISVSESSAAIDANKFYKFGVASDLTITFNAPSDTAHVNTYHFSFTASASTTLGVPASVIWQGGKEPPCVEGNVYEVSIVDDCATYLEFTPYDD